MKKFLKKLNYYGFEPAQYRSCSEQIAEENWKSARIVNNILLVMMAVYALLSLFSVIDRAFLPYYGMTLIYTVLVELLFQMPNHKVPKRVREADMDIGLACAGLLFFGIIASIADPSQVATAFLVAQMLAALFLNYPLRNLILMEIIYMLIFDVSAYMVKTPKIAAGDRLNAFSFLLVAGFIAYFFHKERISHYLKSNHYHFMARIDGLTGLLNHQYFFKAVEQVLGEGRNENLVFAVFDIDHFKTINDRFGHQTGDYCIRAVSANILWTLLHTAPESRNEIIAVLFPEGIQSYIDSTDASFPDAASSGFDGFEKAEAAAGRIGGDEFAVLLGGPDPMDRVRQIEDAIRTVKLPDGRNITGSVGCVRITESQNFKSFYKNADAALYAAKQQGRDQLCVAKEVPEDEYHHGKNKPESVGE
jgi:GGDEF domain-containing protein